MKNNIKKNLVSFGIVLVLILVGYHFLTAVKTVNTPYVQIAGEKIYVTLADTSAEQTQGLSGRESLGENEGMLFIFDKPSKHSFWMKDMNFPIDIIWINENMEIIYIKENATPDSYPETFGSDKDSKYVLEVVSGFSEKHNLKAGDKIIFNF